jgi:universal stress protein A
MPGYQKLLVVLDLSHDSEQVAIAARDLAAYSKAKIVALHVVEFVPIEPMGESLMPTVQIEEDLIKRSRDQLSELAARLDWQEPTSGSKQAISRRKSCGPPRKWART